MLIDNRDGDSRTVQTRDAPQNGNRLADFEKRKPAVQNEEIAAKAILFPQRPLGVDDSSEPSNIKRHAALLKRDYQPSGVSFAGFDVDNAYGLHGATGSSDKEGMFIL